MQELKSSWGPVGAFDVPLCSVRKSQNDLLCRPCEFPWASPQFGSQLLSPAKLLKP